VDVLLSAECQHFLSQRRSADWNVDGRGKQSFKPPLYKSLTFEETVFTVEMLAELE